MNIYDAVLQNIAEQYENEKDSESEIVLRNGAAHNGGWLDGINFKTNKLYKVIFPNPIKSRENFVFCLLTTEEGKSKYYTGTSVKDDPITEYEHTKTSCFIKFSRDLNNCKIFTNEL